EKATFGISYDDVITFVGSCFADNIGSKMIECKYDTDVNPFGTLFNPSSVAAACRMLMRPREFDVADLTFYDGLYHSFMHAGKFSDTSAENCLTQINTARTASATHFKRANRLIITFGTAFVYVLKDSGMTVANCHKLPATYFARKMLSVKEIIDEWSRLITDMKRFNPSIRIVLTVSPIRHFKDGAHLNQVSKSTLMLAVHGLTKIFDTTVSYFPAYEIVIDELRDYRFYASDMLHPSPVAIDYIWEKFCCAYMDEATNELMREVSAINKSLNHRPIDPNSEAHLNFIRQIMSKIESRKDLRRLFKKDGDNVKVY
ncbi:MAG: GSCFA domain-containing protein, partial [Tannerella sp.]|nr:GSCFA domain-containing protein [Tannerella sp.]